MRSNCARVGRQKPFPSLLPGIPELHGGMLPLRAEVRPAQNEVPSLPSSLILTYQSASVVPGARIAMKLGAKTDLRRQRSNRCRNSLRYRKTGHIVTLTMNEPDSMNALSGPDQYADFEKYCARINQDYDVRCVILTGAGRAFSAGGNVKAMQEQKPQGTTAVGCHPR